MHDRNYEESASFLADFFGPCTEHAVELRSFTNQSGEGPPRRLFTRETHLIEAHCRKWDQDGRGMFFGVCTRITGSHSGRRSDLAECPALWVDIDTAKMGLEKSAVVAALKPLPFPPSVIVDSGGGLHGYWLLSEAIDVEGEGDFEEDITLALKQLAAILAGDENVCDLARVMRLPGTMNSKPEHGGLCHVVDASWGQYHVDDLLDWLDWQRPVVERPEGSDEESENPYLAAARRQGFKPPLDVEEALSQMRYLGDGDNSVHKTQLRVAMALARQGVEVEEIIDVLMETTRAAAGRHGEAWNWWREEKKIRALTLSGQKKIDDEKVVSLAKARQKTGGQSSGQTGGQAGGRGGAQAQPKQKEAKKDPIAKAGDGAIDIWHEERGTLMLAEGQAWSYAEGCWQAFDEVLDHHMRVAIQGVVRAMGQKPVTQLINAAWRYIMEHPGLLREGIAWNQSGLIICRNGAIDPESHEMRGHKEEHYATFRVEADIDASATCPIWMAFLESAFGNLDADERGNVVDSLAEWFGSALVRGKTREMTKGLIVYGPSRTGKTQLAQVLRALIGGQATGMRARDLEQHFGMQPLINATAWIADDAVSSGEYLDAERYKVIVTGERVSIPRKNKSNWEGALDMPVCLTANHLPRVKDQSHAVYNRSIVLPMTVEHAETAAEERSIAERVIEQELGGVLNWALDGYRRLKARRYFDLPMTMRNAVETFEDDNNPIGSWMKVAIEPSTLYMVDRRDLLASFNGWQIGEHGADSKAWGGRAVFPAIRQAMPQVGNHMILGTRFLTRIRLTEEGISYIHDLANHSFGKIVGSGEPDGRINRAFQDTATGKESDRKPRF